MSVIKIEKALKLDKVIFVDVRTEGEYEEDHILNAINMPLFKNNEHNDVGTIYKMQGKHEAIQKGFDYVSYKLKDIYLQAAELALNYDNIVIYCARGGMRSGSIVNLLSSLGVNVYQLEGGYKAYRNFVLEYLRHVMDTKNFVSVHGLTGTGKTDLLHLLDEKGIDVLDLEGIAKNSGSTFGFITFDKKPPSQKNFETKLFESIFFSKLCRDYIYDKDEGNILILKECINKFRKRLGNKVVDDYIDLLESGEYKELVKRYLLEYYDPLYMHSVEKYKYSKIINFNDTQKALEDVIDLYESILEGESEC